MQNILNKQTLAAIKVIQHQAIKMFYNKFGTCWKNTINEEKLVYKLDYYCYLHGINDPWYDYSDDPKYAYDSDNS